VERLLCLRAAVHVLQGAFTFRGAMIDMPLVRQAKNIVQLQQYVSRQTDTWDMLPSVHSLSVLSVEHSLVMISASSSNMYETHSDW